MTGGTLRGNLSVGDSAFLKTDGTIIGTSFQASESIHLDGVTRNVAVIDNNGYFHSTKMYADPNDIEPTVCRQLYKFLGKIIKTQHNKS